ncbi:MAG: MFS transporter [Bacteroidetes bacterium]|nr:MAG: MFS transporter [Bacteroidota bacterium]
MTKQKIFTRTIWTLGFVSLFADIASDMLYPVMPIYLKSIGFTALWIGVLEGFAEAVVGLSKGYFGKLSDEKGVRMPFVRLGYFASGIAKSIIPFFASPVWVLFARSADRLGKGIRTGARDAVLSDECSKENKGKVFGLHRAMDTIGAALGPLVALAYLYYFPEDYKTLFFIAFAPGMISVGLTFLVKERSPLELRHLPPVVPKGENLKLPVPPPFGSDRSADSRKAEGRRGFSFFSYLSYWKMSSPEYRKVVPGLLLFAAFNSSDVFLLLMAKHMGIADLDIIMVYIFYNLVYALFALPFGHLADKMGMKKTFMLGLMLFCITYVGMAFVRDTPMLFGLFFIYGLFSAVNEGVSKAWIAKIADPQETATAIGFFSSGTSIAAMIASTGAGLIWVTAGAQITFLISAAGAFLVFIYHLLNMRDRLI